MFLTCCISEGSYHDTRATTGSTANRTAYKWLFSDKCSSVDANALRAAREVDSARSSGAMDVFIGPPTAAIVSSDPPSHPHRTSSSHVRPYRTPSLERDLKRKRDRAEAKDHLEDMVGPKKLGQQGMLEKKRAWRENDHTFREKGDDEYEGDESMLLGGKDSFRDQCVVLFLTHLMFISEVYYSIARRDASRRRFEEKWAASREDNNGHVAK
ncbi:hypothetical protein J3R83DRAFT_6001 [Lanmaoa asiatica]|nr:hypothetical protein J3R83DRAFT_6001 [Lanmaoa asiatica]